MGFINYENIEGTTCQKKEEFRFWVSRFNPTNQQGRAIQRLMDDQLSASNGRLETARAAFK